MIPTMVVLLYLGAVFYIGIFAGRRSRAGAEDYFLAGRSLGPLVFLLSMFGTNMTAFTILGSSGHAFQNGIVTYGLMASSSALIIPLSFFLIGTRVWALGKRHGFMTPVQMFRDRWECGHIGTAIFVLQAALLVPYVIIGVMGGGATLRALSGGLIPYWFGGALVALVVMSYVFFGGMRGTAWVNAFQAALFLSFGAAAVVVIGAGMHGLRGAFESLLDSPSGAALLSRERVPPLLFLSYTFIPLSTIAFPHIGIFCLTARRIQHFKRTVVFYPLCLLAIWFPCVLLGVAANAATEVPGIRAKLEARAALAAPETPSAVPREQLRARARGDDVMLLLLAHYAPPLLAGVLGAGIMAAVMASDSQILALSTMFTEDVFAYYGGKARFGEKVQVQTGRIFVVALTLAAYAIAMRAPESIFELAVQYAFSGYSAMAPLLVAALFWRGSTKWGALASVVWTAAAVAAVALFQWAWPAPRSWHWGGYEVLARTPAGTSVFGLMPVVPMTLVSALLLAVVSTLTRKPGAATLARYFGAREPHRILNRATALSWPTHE